MVKAETNADNIGTNMHCDDNSDAENDMGSLEARRRDFVQNMQSPGSATQRSNGLIDSFTPRWLSPEETGRTLHTARMLDEKEALTTAHFQPCSESEASSGPPTPPLQNDTPRSQNFIQEPHNDTPRPQQQKEEPSRLDAELRNRTPSPVETLNLLQ